MWTMCIIKFDCSRNKGSVKALGPAAHRAETSRSIAPLKRRSLVLLRRAPLQHYLHAAPWPPTHVPWPLNPLLASSCSLLQFLTAALLPQRRAALKTTANAIVSIINDNAASVWMSSEHVGRANAGYNPTFGGKPFGSRTTIACFLRDLCWMPSRH